MNTESFMAKIEQLATAANRDTVLRRIGRHCRADVLLMADDAGVYLRIDEGKITQLDPAPAHLRSVSFEISASLPTWDAFWGVTPPPGYHDIFAMARFGHAKINGDLSPLLEHLAFFKRLLWLPRRVG